MDNFQSFDLEPGRHAKDIMWDVNDPRFFAVFTEYSKGKLNEGDDDDFNISSKA